ncbi:MAG: nicotinate-nucleotide adenylyltransferase [Candidatus Cloacimonadota bacterium]|nr:nicotinate-nucleotide adenylyltransferase [Candidatus Cloacimonadota bacterium]
MNRIGLFGGTFNPLHLGHIKVAKTVLHNLNLDKILFLPSGNPVLKSVNDLLDFAKRCEIIEKILIDFPKFEISRLDRSEGKKSYTSILLRKLLKNSNKKYYFIIGEDNVTQLPLWNEFEWLIENVKFVVVSRSIENSAEQKNLNYYEKLKFVQMQPIDISSSQIRKYIKQKKSIKNLVPQKVEELIKKNYQTIFSKSIDYTKLLSE